MTVIPRFDEKLLDTKISKAKKQFQGKFKEYLFHPDNKKKSMGGLNRNKNWSNKLFWEDNLNVLYYLLNEYENSIDLVYIDPPFFSGVDYHIEIKENGKKYESIAYNDTWQKNLTNYLYMLNERLYLIHKLLKIDGLIFLHSDWHACHYIRMLLDNIFSPERFVNEIIWYYYNKYSAGKNNLPRAHDNILVYSKSENYTFNELRIPRKEPIKQLKRIMVDGVLKNAKDENGHVIYRIVKDKKMDDVWKIPCLQPASKEWTGYPTQKHQDLIERIIKLGSNEGDLIADFFCGSGTTLLVADQLNRKWMGSDISKYAIYLSRKRLLENYYRKKNTLKPSQPFILSSILTKEKQEIIDSSFFDRELIIKRKK